jgi:hypothetical protein
VIFCEQNPVTFLMTDKESGTINPEVINERVLSGIVEFEVPLEKAPAVLSSIKEVSKELDTVFSLDIISFVEQDDSIPLYDILADLNMKPSPNGKNNMGLGKPAYPFYSQEEVS